MSASASSAFEVCVAGLLWITEFDLELVCSEAMRIMGWNCCGLNSGRAVRALLDVQKNIKPDVCFLSETHLSKVRAAKLMRRTGFDHMLVDESDGRSDGLLMMWGNHINLVELSVTKNHIDVMIEGDEKWRLTGIYGEPNWDWKERTWTNLRDLHELYKIPWLVLGDFNEILFNSEKERGNLRPVRFMQEFQNCLDHCGLGDMEYVGDKFTWRRG